VQKQSALEASMETQAICAVVVVPVANYKWRRLQAYTTTFTLSLSQS